MQTIHPNRSTVALDKLLEKMMMEVRNLVLTYAESMVPSSGLGTAPNSSTTRTGMSTEDQEIENWLRAIREWPVPKPLFDWDEMIDALKESTQGIAKARYGRWRDNIAKRPLTPSDDDIDDIDELPPIHRMVLRSSKRAASERDVLPQSK